MDIRPAAPSTSQPTSPNSLQAQQATTHAASPVVPAAVEPPAESRPIHDPPKDAQAELKETLERINQSLREHGRELMFAIDEDSQRTIVKIIDKTTQEVVRQIPSEETLNIAKALDQAVGLLVKVKA